MGTILKVKDANGKWVEIPALMGKNVYEFAVDNGFSGTEKEFAEKFLKLLGLEIDIDDGVMDTSAYIAVEVTTLAVRDIEGYKGIHISPEGLNTRTDDFSNIKSNKCTLQDALPTVDENNQMDLTKHNAVKAKSFEAVTFDGTEPVRINPSGIFVGGADFSKIYTSNSRTLQDELDDLKTVASVRTVTINLPANAWVSNSDIQHRQRIILDGTSPYSKIDLQPTIEQLSIFYEKDITFVTENDNGKITVYCIGQKPTLDYSMQATITEVGK